MYESTTTCGYHGLGKVSTNVRLEDSGDASVSIKTDVGTASEKTSSICIPNALISAVYSQIEKIYNMERLRRGLPEDAEDEDEGLDCM